MLSGMCTIEHVSSLDGFLDCCSVVVGVMIAVMSRYLTIVDLTTFLSDMYIKMGGGDGNLQSSTVHIAF